MGSDFGQQKREAIAHTNQTLADSFRSKFLTSRAHPAEERHPEFFCSFPQLAFSSYALSEASTSDRARLSNLAASAWPCARGLLPTEPSIGTPQRAGNTQILFSCGDLRGGTIRQISIGTAYKPSMSILVSSQCRRLTLCVGSGSVYRAVGATQCSLA